MRWLACLAIGAAGGVAFQTLALPIPWLLGPFLTIAAVNLAGWRIGPPPGGRQTGQVLIGLGVGLYFTPAIAAIVVAQLPAMVLVAAASLAVAWVGVIILRRVAGLDTATAFFGSVPGGMAEMLSLGDREGAKPVPLTVAQTVRVSIVVLTVPPALTYFGTPGNDMFTAAAGTVWWPWFAALLAGAGAVAYLLNRLGMPNAWMLGACTVAGALTVSEIELSAMPRALSLLAQLLIGTTLGARFEREAMASVPRVILGATLTSIVMIAVSVALAAAIAAWSGLSFSAMVAATAPGGIAEMTVTAQVLELGVPVVVAYHVVRVFMITLFVFPLFRAAQRLGARRAARSRPPEIQR